MDTNARLIQAVQLATKKLASTGKFDQLLKEVLQLCVEAVGASGGTIYVHEPDNRRLRFQHVLPEDVADRLPTKDIPDNYGVAGQAFQSRKTVSKEFAPRPQLSDFEQATGVVLRNMIACPLSMEDETPIGVVQLLNKNEGSFNDTDAAVLETVAAVSAMAYVNSRLVEEATRASSLLGMGKVSHDIGNLAASLYANLSFSELAMGGLKQHLEGADVDESVTMYVDTLDGMFTDIQKSVDRIVGYSRLISDLSAGRSLRPEKVLAPLAETIQTSAAYLETEGRRNHVALRYEIQEDAPPLYHDELYLFRIVQNLVGNAIKAVKETIPDDWQARMEGNDEDVILGEVIVRYFFRDGQHIIEVQDSGPGMTADTAERILKGRARSQWDKGGGSGWGTKIVLELAATHDAEVEIDSEIGVGSTFRVKFPQNEGPAA
ncbi:MAG TPA: ATP-binding protein [Fimbriimonadaceae bacterium]|nr:ATP-binding protein [Fimbriimonadaceae bacterium]